jgi:hypothetical protein
MKFELFSMDIYNFYGPNVDVFTCITSHEQDSQAWIWNLTHGTVRNKFRDQCITVRQEHEIWAGPLSDGSQAVVLLNRADSGSESITVKWSDIGFPVDHSAVVRDLWARKDIGTFTGSYTSPNIDHHAVMMLKITPTK